MPFKNSLNRKRFLLSESICMAVFWQEAPFPADLWQPEPKQRVGCYTCKSKCKAKDKESQQYKQVQEE